jgi:hypothetical protein
MAAPAQIEAAPDVATPEPKAEEPAKPEVSDAERKALEAFQQGIDETQLFKYEAAIETLSSAYSQLGKLEAPSPRAQAARIETMYRLAEARRKFGQQSQDSAMLNSAKQSLSTFESQSKGSSLPLGITADDITSETAAIEKAIADLQAAKKAESKPVKRKKKAGKKAPSLEDRFNKTEL